MSQKTFTNRSWRYFYLSSVLSVLNNRGCCKTTFPSTTVKTVYSNNHHTKCWRAVVCNCCAGVWKNKTKQQIVSVIKLSSLTPAELFLKGESFISIQRKISLNVLLENVVHLSALHYITVILLNRAADIQEYQFDIIRNSKKNKTQHYKLCAAKHHCPVGYGFFFFFFYRSATLTLLNPANLSAHANCLCA